MSKMLLLLMLGLVGGAPTERILQLRMPGVIPTYDNQRITAEFDLVELTGQSNPVYVKGADIFHRSPGEIEHVTLSRCHTPTNFRPEMHNACSQRLFGWNSDSDKSEFDDALFEDASYMIDLKENPQLILTVHYYRPLAEPDYDTGMDLKYQLEPTKYKIGTITMFKKDLSLPGNTKNVFADLMIKFMSPQPLNFYKAMIHTHELGRMGVLYAYNNKTDTFRLIAKGRARDNEQERFDITVYPGEYLVGRCTYDTTGVDHQVVYDEEQCRFTAYYYSTERDPLKYHAYMVSDKGTRNRNYFPVESMIQPYIMG